MSNKLNPVHARAGSERRFSVTVVHKGFLKHVATLHDRLDSGFDGLDFAAITGERASLAAWAHAARDATFDHRGYSIV